MICFRDMTFCANSGDCANNNCHRQFTDETRAQAIKWWGSDSAPVAFGVFKDTCGKFMEKNN